MVETFSNLGSSTLAVDISGADLSLEVAEADEPFPFPPTGNFRVILDEEIIIVGTRTGNVFSDLTRQAEDPADRPASAHTAGTAVVQVLTVGAFEQGIADALAASSGAVVSGDGSPEGVVTATPGVLYTDELNGEAYLKAGGQGTTGWTLLTHAEVTVHAGYSGLLDDDHAQYVQRDILTSQGELFVRNNSGVIVRLAGSTGPGSDGLVLTADSTATRGMKYA